MMQVVTDRPNGQSRNHKPSITLVRHYQLRLLMSFQYPTSA